MKLENLIDLEAMRKILDDFYKIAPFPTAILNLEGDVLLKSHWQPLCTQYHRVNSETAERCRESDTHFSDRLEKGNNKRLVYQCRNGLCDAAFPIVIDGQHLGNFFIGQFLLEEADEGFFKEQAQRYGFPMNEYLEALSKVPIISEEDLDKRLNYLCGFAEFLGNIGLKELQRDRAEVALQKSEEQYRQLFQNANEAIFIAQDGRLVFSNPMTVKILGYSEAELLKKGFTEYIHPEDRKMVLDRHLRRLKGEELPDNYLFRIIQRDDNTRWVDLNTVLIEWGGKAATLNFMSDTTERKRAEEQIKASLKEKETLLQEIHHRVKNNMQVISSLLKLQSNGIEDIKIKDKLKESQNRIFAMSAVHETLHGSENLSEIDLNKYLSKIASSVFQTSSIDPNKVNLKSDIEKIPISINQASPLGLTINELISNSLKFAFPDDRDGKITIEMKKLDEKLELIVMDDGVGIPDELDWKNSSTLGLKLVRALVENQLDGSIDMENKNGTKFTIKFNIET